MYARESAAILTFITAVFFFLCLKTYVRSPGSVSERTDRELMEVIRQRNNLSQLLNLRQQRIGQLECQASASRKISTTGGWCAQFSAEEKGHHRTDEPLIPALADLFAGKTVASFGDGPGRYKQMVLDTGKVRSYDAFDGAPFSETTSHGRVQFLDLTLPQYGLPLYDWVISLEVAEHIPREYESVYMDNIVRHAKEGVVLSWSVPGQPGLSHVNNRPHE